MARAPPSERGPPPACHASGGEGLPCHGRRVMSRDPSLEPDQGRSLATVVLQSELGDHSPHERSPLNFRLPGEVLAARLVDEARSAGPHVEVVADRNGAYGEQSKSLAHVCLPVLNPSSPHGTTRAAVSGRPPRRA